MNNERPNKEFSFVEVRIGFQCSEEGCDWKMVAKNSQKPPEQYQALPAFGKHNLEKHNGSIGVHIVPITKIKKVTFSG